ncbi:MAG: SDR family NAD(P)-dependent oxidoreductase, partial [Alphaproteobacteria bacterium]
MIDYGLTDKVAIVTGGSDGLGRATAHLLATEGAKVVICGRRADYLKQAAETLSADTGGSVVAVPADVTSAADCERLVQATVDQFGKLDILVNNAGT